MRMRVAFIYVSDPCASHKRIPFLSIHARHPSAPGMGTEEPPFPQAGKSWGVKLWGRWPRSRGEIRGAAALSLPSTGNAISCPRGFIPRTLRSC